LRLDASSDGATSQTPTTTYPILVKQTD